jgi:hypothetical protein
MNDWEPFYCFCFSHGQISSKEKISKEIRRVHLPNNKEYYIPLFTFGTMGTITQGQRAIPCFHMFSNIYGNEFCEKMANVLIRYGDNYMIRYKLPENYTITDLAVEYFIKTNKEEVIYTPQNRFYTFHKKEHKPYDYHFVKKDTECFTGNVKYPTYKLSVKNGKSNYSLSDIVQGNKSKETNENNILFYSVDEFENILENNIVENGKPLFNTQDVLNYENVSFIYPSKELFNGINPQVNLFFNVKFGDTYIENAFFINPLGTYFSRTIPSSEYDGVLRITDHNDIKLSNLVEYCSNYREDTQRYLCKGIFTFNCKSANPNIYDQLTVLNFTTQKHQEEGESIIPSNERSFVRKEKKKENIKKNPAVKKYLKHD